MRKALIAACVAAVLAIGGLLYQHASGPARSASGQSPQPNSSGCLKDHSSCAASPRPATTPARMTTSPGPVAAHKVLVIVEENHSGAEAMANMPHLAAWAARYGQATHYAAAGHPSLPNYLAIGGGSTFGVTDDIAPSSHPISGASAFGLTLTAGKTAKTYAETMPGNCGLTSAGDYAVKHNEWAYFADPTERAGCIANELPMGTTASGTLLTDVNLGRLPVTGQMTPNLCNDAHDCSMATADAWLNGWVPKLMAGQDYTSGDLTILITFDEDDSSADNNVAFVVIDPRLTAKTVTTAANH
jgi:hypothetical protein